MTQLQQLTAMLDHAGTAYEKQLDSRDDTLSIVISNGDTESTWFIFDYKTGDLLQVQVTSSHYSE
jgi:hypothetical protein